MKQVLVTTQMCHLKRTIFIMLWLFYITVAVSANDWLIQYTFPIYDKLLYSFTDSPWEGTSFLAPIEIKRAFKIGDHNMSLNGGASLFFEDAALTSVNLSAGTSWYGFGEPLTFFYCSLYPLYELPTISLKQEPLHTLKGAFDIGLSLPFLFVTQIYTSIYFRMGVVYASGHIIMEEGLAVGLRLNKKEKYQMEKY
jgi:hypothetical protein